MKLIKCYISSFGNLKDFTYEFNGGLNTIKEDNGWGKSTFANFIKIMFYGINDSKRTVSGNERWRFKPWNSTEKFGGYVQFEWDGKEYKIERFFGNKESEDTVRLFDVATGKEYTNTENLGARIFNIDEEGFLSTTYFSEKDFEIKSNSSITAKFNKVCEIKDSEDFNDALKRLEEKKKRLKIKGDKGLIADTKRQILSLDQQLSENANANQVVTTIKSEIKVLEDQLAENKKIIDNLSDKLTLMSNSVANSQRKKSYLQLVDKRAETERNLLLLKKKLNNNVTSNEEISAYLECVTELGKIKTDIENTKKDIEDLRVKKSEQIKNHNDAPLFFGAILFSMIFVAGIVVLFFNLVTGIILVSASAVLTAFFMFLFLHGRKRFYNIKGVTEDVISEKLKNIHSFEDIYGQYWTKINEFLYKFNRHNINNINGELLSILNDSDSFRRCNDELRAIDRELAEFEKDKAQLVSMKDATQSDFESIKRELNLKRSDYERINKELLSKQSNLKFYENMSSENADLESRKAELTEQLEQYQEQLRILNLTTEYFNKADENLKLKYRQPLQASLNKYLSYIDNTNKKADIDIELNITVDENCGNMSTDYYSKGYQNLFAICKRFALTDVLFTGEKPFIILDDPFYNLDDDKIKSSLELVKKLSDDYQIIYFVCHDSRRI